MKSQITLSVQCFSATRPGKDPLLPVLCILDTSVPQDRQQWVLEATKEAKVCQSSKPSVMYDDSSLRDLKTACEEGNISALVSQKHNQPMIHVDVGLHEKS